MKKKKIWSISALAILIIFVAVFVLTRNSTKTNDTEAESASMFQTVELTETEPETEDDRVTDARDSGNTVIVIQNKTAAAGDTVTVKAYIVNNPGILGMSLTLNYDEEILNLVSAESGDAVNDVLEFSQSKELKDGAVFFWDGESISEEQTKDGVLLKLTFEVNEKASTGKSTIVLTPDVDGTVDNDLATVSLSVEDGVITVE